jgi:signal transduction histidine kinase
LTEATDRFWQAVDRAFELAVAKNDHAAVEVIRQSVLPRHAELSGLVSQLLIRNTQVEDDAVEAAREVYTRVIHQIYGLMVVLLVIVCTVGIFNILATRRAFEELHTVSHQMRALTWRMLRMQEQLQARVARELHDEFGQILTALTMLIGRVKGKVMAESEREKEQPQTITDSSSSVARNAQQDHKKEMQEPGTTSTTRDAERGAAETGEFAMHESATGTVGALGGRFILSAARLRIVPPQSIVAPSTGAPSSTERHGLELRIVNPSDDASTDVSTSHVADVATFPGASHDDGKADQEKSPARSFQEAFLRDLEEVEALTRETLERIRNDARLLHPTVLDDFGLEEALCAHVLDFGKRHRLVAWFSRNTPIGKVSDDVRANVFRIAQEALTNVARHSGAKEVWVRLKRKGTRLQLEIEDYGKGLPWTASELAARRSPADSGLGMIGMRERAEALGGSFEVRRGERGGVLIYAEMAIDAEMPDDSRDLEREASAQGERHAEEPRDGERKKDE